MGCDGEHRTNILKSATNDFAKLCYGLSNLSAAAEVYGFQDTSIALLS